MSAVVPSLPDDAAHGDRRRTDSPDSEQIKELRIERQLDTRSLSFGPPRRHSRSGAR